MNYLFKLSDGYGVLRNDLDYHVVRASMVLIFLMFGYQKWFEYEAKPCSRSSATARLSSECIQYFASAARAGSWASGNGYSARSSLQVSGTKRPEHLVPSVESHYSSQP